MRIVVQPGNMHIDNISIGETLRDLIARLGLFENEVICIDNITGRICFLNDVIGEDTDWTVKIVVSQG